MKLLPVTAGAAPSRTAMLGASALAASLCWMPHARAQSAQDIASIENQIRALQHDLGRVKTELAHKNAQIRAAQRQAAAAQQSADEATHRLALMPVANSRTYAAQVAAAPGGPLGLPPITSPGRGSIRIGGVTVTLGGFIAAETAIRSSNENADIGSSFGGIPLGNSVAGAGSSFTETARQSRVSLLVQGNVGRYTTLTAYGEFDFLGAAQTANSNESNSYTPRIRHLYAEAENSYYGIHTLFGQTWSLLTLNGIGMTPRKEVTPLTIDAQYVPGFSWTRQPQVRIWKDLDDHKVNVGFSIENPATTFSLSPNNTTITAGQVTTAPGLPASARVTYGAGSGVLFNSANNYALTPIPDFVAKATYDPGWGHYEVYGLARFFETRNTIGGSTSNTIVPAGGGGAAFILPLIGNKLLLQGSALAGAGIGRYGTSGLPDATIGRNGDPTPIPEVMGLVGLVSHPNKDWDLYAYVGTEQEQARAFTDAGKGYGYGSPLYSNGGCSISFGSCVGNTSGVTQGTVGLWYKPLHGDYGTVKIGLQYSHTVRQTFQGIGGEPKGIEDMGFISLRYYPFE